MKRILTTLLLFLLWAHSYGQKTLPKFTVTGLVKDAKTGEELIGSSVYVKETKQGVTTNTYGFYSLSLPEGVYTLQVTYLGYVTHTQSLNLKADLRIDIKLEEQKSQLNEVVVKENKTNKNINETKMSTVSVDIKEVKKIPILMGEVDIVKAVQLMPGVQSAGDGSTNMIVRGGNIDQNLILLDEAIVYNPSHAVGFFSVFNGDVIKDFELYKGGIPSSFGGRSSSVMDVRMRDGNNNKFGVSGGIGVLSSRLTVEGPIQKEKSSFIISGRRTYFDLFLKMSPDENINQNTAGFYDLNAKANFTLSQKDRLYVSGYFGRDNIAVANVLQNGWGNQTATLRWNHIYTKKLFSNVTLIYSRFDYGFGLDIPSQSFNYKAEIANKSIKADYTYYVNPKNTIRFGSWITQHSFQPGELKPTGDNSILQYNKLDKQAALEQAYYVSHKVDLSSRLTTEYGVRFSAFNNIGADNKTYRFSADGLDILDTNVRRTGSFYGFVAGIEPRLNVKYSVNSTSSLKLSYNRMRQYLHMISPVTASTGQDMWIPSSPNIKPQIADQIAVGYFKNIGVFEASVETYYKYMQNVIDLRDNSNAILLNKTIEREVRQGKGHAYGVEFLVKKPSGKTTGWASYTLAKSDRQIDGVNQGKTYPFRFDRRHNINLVISHNFNERISLSANWIFASGEAVTFPTARYEYEGRVVPQFSNRNEFRMPSYHRADLSLTVNRKKQEGKVYKNESSWVFSIYNVYGRKNAYSITFREEKAPLKDADGNIVKDDFGKEKYYYTGKTEAVKTYLFSFVPSVTYNFKF